MTGITPDNLLELVERIVNSGVLGRSKTYGAILKYLAECSIKGETPKEAAIAVDVLGREADFDVTKDSIVRVHIYHLRNKLDTYYARFGEQEDFRIDIPKGQYIITARPNTGEAPREQIKPVEPVKEKRSSPVRWLVGIIGLLLGLIVFILQEEPVPETVVEASRYQSLQPWQAFLDDDLPVLLVIGDYFIFGEMDEEGNVARMVREFDINSSDDLEVYQAGKNGQESGYFDLDLSYIPVGVAPALVRVMPILNSKADRMQVKMMSDLETGDLADNHIIYLGYLSGVETLLDLMFADSGLSIGTTYDELINLDTNEYYIGSSGLSGDESFQDYGLVTTFPAPNGNHFLMIAGMRDEGLINVARQITTLDSLEALKAEFGDSDVESFEALYEVFGYDKTNFGGELVYTRKLDTEIIWETRLISQ